MQNVKLSQFNLFLLLSFSYFRLIAALAGSQVLNKNEPTFITRSEAFKFAVGDVITLPCEVTHPGNLSTHIIQSTGTLKQKSIHTIHPST